MARRRSAGFPRRAGRKADLRWTFGSASFLAQAAGTVATTILSSGNTSQTLMRTRGELLAFIDAVQAPGALVRVGCALLVVPSGLGATVLSSPLTDGEAPFFWYEAFSIGHEEMVTDVIGVEGLPIKRIPLDAKAMRVIRPDQEVQAVLEVVNIGTAANINVSITARFLLAD